MKITSENYVEEALRTDSFYNGSVEKRCNSASRLIHASLGIATEAGEFVDCVKKRVFYGKDFDRINAIEELGDLLWYIAVASDELNTSFEEIMTVNIEKLKARYPEKFTEENAIERDLKVERKILDKAEKHECKCKSKPNEFADEDYFHNRINCKILKAEELTEGVSKRGQEWLKFSAEVFSHIEEYCVPQYGDAPNDQISEWTIADCLKAVNKRIARHGRNSRPGQEELDFLKMAHEVCIAWNKFLLTKGA